MTWKDYKYYGCLYRLLLVAVLAVALFLGGCCPVKTVTSENFRENRYTETDRAKTDSVFVARYDSIIIRQTLDTVFLEKYHIRTSYRLKTDTVCLRDSVYVYRNIEKTVTKAGFTFFEKAGMTAMLLLVLSIIYTVIKRRLKSV